MPWLTLPVGAAIMSGIGGLGGAAGGTAALVDAASKGGSRPTGHVTPQQAQSDAYIRDPGVQAQQAAQARAAYHAFHGTDAPQQANANPLNTGTPLVTPTAGGTSAFRDYWGGSNG